MITPIYIETEVCKTVEKGRSMLWDKSQTTHIIMPRKVCMFLQKKALGVTYTHLARTYGKDDRAVRNSVESIQAGVDKGDTKVGRIASKLPLDLRNFLTAGLNKEQTEALRIPAIRVTALHAKPRRERIVQQNSESVRVVNTTNGVRWQMLNT